MSERLQKGDDSNAVALLYFLKSLQLPLPMHLPTFALAAVALLAPVRTIPTGTPKLSFFLAGDSTVAPGSGWGDDFCSLVVPSFGSCLNEGVGGTTTVSYRAGGHWAALLDGVKSAAAKGEAPIASFQFGHNDQKAEANISLALYSTNLGQFVDDVRAVGGTPVVVTSLARRTFTTDNVLVDILGPWARAAAKVATGKGAKYLELHDTSFAYVRSIGNVAAQRLDFVPGDMTHLNRDGGIVFGRLVGDLWKKSQPDTRPVISANATLSADIAAGKAVF
ncbi:hypothetical protein HKX48_001416 [Thoreauomyces humboldtii]|nr:hypothetical protein HKX48_001416 [Thoreauomyces humboldtii]